MPLSAGPSGLAFARGPGVSPPRELGLSAPPWTRRGSWERRGTGRVAFPRHPSPGSQEDRKGQAARRTLTRVRVEVEASHILPGRQRAGQARGRQASSRGCAHAVAVHGQAGQQRRRGAVHGPRGPKVSAIHPPLECRGQPPTRPAGLAQWDLKVRPRRSPRVLGRRGLRGGHGGGGQRGLRSAAGPRPGAHRRPTVGPLRAAWRSCAKQRTRRLGSERRRATEETQEEEKGKKEREKQTSFRKSSCSSGPGAADLVTRNEIGSGPFSTKTKKPGFRLQAPGDPARKVAGGALRPYPDSASAADGSSQTG